MEFPESVREFVAEKMAEFKIPGISIGLLTADGVAVKGFGVTNVDYPLAVSAETLFQIGSITKTMTATLLMMLSEDGKLDLDAPVQSILPEFRVRDVEVSASVTVRNLLTHATGWVGDLFLDTGSGADAKALYVEAMANLEQIAPPGFAFSYNNSAFSLAGRVIEVVTGQLYEEVLRERLFEPLGMTESFMRAREVITRSFAVGHLIRPKKDPDGNETKHAVVARDWALTRAAYSAGAVIASAGDMLKYAQFYLNKGRTADGTQLLSPEAIDELWTPQFPLGEGDDAVAHSWFVSKQSGHTSYGHGGGTVGQVSSFDIFPEQKLAYITLTNCQSGGNFSLAFRRFLFEKMLDSPIERPQLAPANDAALNELVGRYDRPMNDLLITREDDQLMLQTVQKLGFPTPDSPLQPPSPLMPCGLLDDGNIRGAVKPYRGLTAQVIRNADGSIGWVRFGGRLHRRTG